MICVRVTAKNVGLAVLLIWPVVGNCELTVFTFMFYVNIIFMVDSLSTVFENVGFVKYIFIINVDLLINFLSFYNSSRDCSKQQNTGS